MQLDCSPEASTARTHFLSEAEQKRWIETGVELFIAAFGRPPVTTCAPGYRANETAFQIWRRHGIEAFQTPGARGASWMADLVHLERNVSWEPFLYPALSVGHAIGLAEQAVACGFPIVICSRSINYISRFGGYSERGRDTIKHVGANVQSKTSKSCKGTRQEALCVQQKVGKPWRASRSEHGDRTFEESYKWRCFR
jgi:hypothetical protein